VRVVFVCVCVVTGCKTNCRVLFFRVRDRCFAAPQTQVSERRANEQKHQQELAKQKADAANEKKRKKVEEAVRKVILFDICVRVSDSGGGAV